MLKSKRSIVGTLVVVITVCAFGVLSFTSFAQKRGSRASGVAASPENTNYFVLAPGVPFTQNWTNTGLITTTDDWSNVPSIIGYRGDDLTTVTATDPQTITADGSGTPVQVVANAADANGTSGGNYEVEIANPTVAFQGSGTADAPHIVISVNTLACNGGFVRYNLRDIDGATTDNVIQPVALQYRVGGSGSYTNIPAAFVADASSGPSLATLVTSVNVPIPAPALGQTQVQFRVMTTNAVGSDEMIGVDDIVITCGTQTASTVSVSGRVTTASGRGVTNAAVMISGGSLAQPRAMYTGRSGVYSFEGIDTGYSYVVTVGSQRYTFSPSSRVIAVSDSVSDANFTADQ